MKNTILVLVLVFCIYFINFENAHSQTDPLLEITLDSTNVNFPLHISILNNTKSDIALIKIKAINPTKILSFQTDSNQLFAYPIGISGLGIRPQPQITFFQTGKNLFIARMMTDYTNNLQTFNIDFLDINGNLISQQTINLLIPNKTLLTHPCNLKSIDLTSGVDEFGELLPHKKIDLSWIASIGDFQGLPPQTTSNVYTLTPVSAWFRNSAVNWLGWDSTRPNMPNGFYTSWKTFCVNKDSTEILFNIFCNTDDRGKVYLVYPDGNEIFLGNSAGYNAQPSQINYETILNYGTYYLRISTENSGGGPTGFHLNSGSNILVLNGGSISLPSYNCCIPEPTLIINEIDFGKIKVGNFKDSLQTFTIQNLSSFPLEIIETKHNLPNIIDFSTLGGGGSFTLAPNEEKLMDLRFSPSFVGNTSGTLEFHYNGIGSPAIVKLFGEGLKKIPIIQSTLIPFVDLVCDNESNSQIKIENIGEDELIISELNITGSNNNDFILNQTLPLVIQPDSSINIPMTFRPSTSGPKNASLEIKSNSDIDSILTIGLYGNKESVELLVTPSIDLGILCPNESKVFDIIINNISTIATKANLSGDNEIQISTPNNNILSGNQLTVSCEFTGISQVGSFNRLISIQDTCGKIYQITIAGFVETPKLSIVDINFSTVVGKTMTNKISITNTSNRDVTINSLIGLQSPFSIIGNPFPLNILANTDAEIAVEFKPIDDKQIIQNLSVIGDPCNIISNFDIFGNGIWATVELITSLIEAYAGDIIEVPIILNTSQNLQLSGINSINAELSFNPTLLYPLEYSQEFIDDTTAFIKLSNLVIADTVNIELSKVKFRVGLGNRIDCALNLQNIETIGGNAKINLLDGNFKLLGVCYDGGVRLLNPNSVVSMANISPNPVNSIITIDLNLIEIGNTEVSIYNLLGEKVKIIFSKEITETGIISINADLSDLSNGQYVIILTTPTYLEKKNILLIK